MHTRVTSGFDRVSVGMRMKRSESRSKGMGFCDAG